MSKCLVYGCWTGNLCWAGTGEIWVSSLYKIISTVKTKIDGININLPFIQPMSLYANLSLKFYVLQCLQIYDILKSKNCDFIIIPQHSAVASIY